MSSTLFPNQANQNLQNALQQAKQMANNPNATQNVLRMLGGGSPKEMFYAKCKEMNVDPEAILALIK